ENLNFLIYCTAMESEQILGNSQEREKIIQQFLTVEMLKGIEVPTFENPVELDRQVESSYKVSHDLAKLKYLVTNGVDVPGEWFEIIMGRADEVPGEEGSKTSEGWSARVYRENHAQIVTMTVLRRKFEDIFLLMKSGISDADLANELLLHS